MSAADKYAILYFLNEGANGIYSVAGKIPAVINVVGSVFFQAWQLSAMEEAEKKDRHQFYSSVFRCYSLAMLICASALILLLKPVFSILVAEKFYSAWQVSPFLLIATVFSGFSSFFGTNYTASKKTKGALLSSMLGATVNISLNVVLTPKYGVNGAAFATLVSYLVTFVFRSFNTRTFVKVDFCLLKFIPICVLIVIQAFISTTDIACSEIYQSIILLAIIASSYKDIKVLFIPLFAKIKVRRHKTLGGES